MSIRGKTLVLTGAALLCMMAALFVLTHEVMLRSFSELEGRRASEDVGRVKAAFFNSVKEMGNKVLDWSAWDDTYAFIQHPTAQYIDANLNPMTFDDMRFNLVVYFDGNGKMVYGAEYDAKAKVERGVSEERLDRLTEGGMLFMSKDVNGVVDGLMQFPEGVMIVAARPIVTSKKEGPSVGTLVVGRWFDAGEVARLSDVTYMNVKSARAGAGNVPGDFQEAGAKLSSGNAVFVKNLDESRIAGYTYVNDVFGKRAVLLRVDMPRDIYRQGAVGARFFYLLFGGIGLFSVVLILALLDKLMLSRLAVLSRRIWVIGRRGDMSARLPEPERRDELSSVAAEVNRMLDELESSQEELRRQSALKESEERYRRLVEFSPDAVIIVRDSRVVFVNAEGVRLFCADKLDEVLGEELTDVLAPEDEEAFVEWFERIRDDSEPLRMEHRFKRCDGSTMFLELAGTAFVYEEQAAVQLVAHDVTERRRAEERLEYLAYHDVLTGLPNRFLFDRMLESAMGRADAEGESLAVLLLDLDRFKDINDTMGHVAGDVVLKEVAARLRGRVRAGDFLARYSGDEFLVIVNGVWDGSDAEAEASRIFHAFAEPFVFEGHELFLSASIGVCLYPADGDSAEKLIMNADMAMYRAKEKGTDVFYQVFSADISLRVAERKSLEDDLHGAVERGEFFVHYQPQVSTFTGEVVGAEALLRWMHPTLGVVPPKKFIGVAEDSGLIIPIGEWVLRSVCGQAKEWRDRGLPRFTVAVNLSAKQFENQDLVHVVKWALDDSGLAPEFLELEITESTAMQDMEGTVEVLHGLRALGVRISIDDFGTGHSSLGYLKRFPINAVKLAGAFLQDVLLEGESAAIVEAVVIMAHVMNRRVVAEEVEEVEQFEFLKRVGCDVIQGHLFSAALPADKFEEFVRGRKE